MESSLQRRRKITLLFLLGVGIPSLVLSYLAFRGIRNELALIEQRRVDEHRTLSRFLSDTVSTEIGASEQAVARALRDHDPIHTVDAGELLSDLGERVPLVEQVFLFDESGVVHLPAADLLYHSDGSLTSAASSRSGASAAAAHLQTAQQAEFRRRQFGEALAGYRSAYTAASDPAQRAQAVVAIERVQRKSGRLNAAIVTCSTLVRDYGGVRTAAGLPVGPIALLELGSLLLATGDTVAALNTLFELYEGLVEANWEIERGQFQFFAGQAGDSIASVLASSPAGTSLDPYRSSLENLQSKELQRSARAERLLLFQETAGANLRSRWTDTGAGSGVAGSRFDLEISGQSFFVSLLGEDTSGGTALGLVFDADRLSDLVHATMEQYLDPTTSDWLLKGTDGRVLLERDSPPTGPVTINATFADNFPPWLIEFHQRPQSAYRLLFASGQSIYLYMFLLIASILVFGLVLTIRAVRHELELARLKSDFVSTVSHEFKSPLTSIRHLAEMLQAGSVPSEERRQRYYDVMVEQSARLSSLVTNILDLARIEEGKKEFLFEQIDVGELVRDLVTTTQQRVGHEGYVVEPHVQEPLPSVRADRTAISRAISNLVENAIQYCGDTMHVSVSVSAHDGGVSVSVKDSGVGIPDHEVGRVFDRFYRGSHPQTRSVRGSGLGLTLVKEIVEAHHGDVTVESEPGRGSTFTIKLPVWAEQENAEDPDS